MIGQLCSGTLLNPTLSVTAPPGTQFYNANPKPVPIVYGNAFVEGTIISDIYAQILNSAQVENLHDSQVTAFGVSRIVSVWQAICCGKIKLNWILVDSVILITAGVAYDPLRFNAGDPVKPGGGWSSAQNEFPPLTDVNVPGGGTAQLPYLAPLHGIAHYSLIPDDGVTITNHVPKVQYDVTRILNTGLSVNGDDIPLPADDNPVVSNYLSYSCSWGGKNSADVSTQLAINCPIGLINPGDQIIFYAPTNGNTLPLDQNNGNAPIVAGKPYFIEHAQQSLVDGAVRIVTVYSVGNSGSIIAPDHYKVGYYCSLVLQRNAGNNPASVIWDLLTNAFYGLGLSAVLDSSNPDINVASFQYVLNFFFNSTAKPYGVNCSFQDKSTAKEMINKICEWTDCILTLDNDGRFFLTVNEADRVNTSGRINGGPGLPVTLSTDDFASFAPNIQTFDNTTNEFRGKFISFADSYTALEVFFRNEANINATGTARSKEYDISGMIFPDIVAIRLFEIAKRESFPLITLQTVTKIGMLTALVNDIFRVTFPEYGIDDYFKITKIVLDALETSQVKVEWSQCPELMFDLNSTSLSQASPTVPSSAIPGGSLVVENLTFPAGTNLSTPRSVAYTTDADSTVVWGVGQEDTGALVYDPDSGFANHGDYTIVGHTQVKLNPVKFANEMQANVLGLLNVDTY